MTELYTPEVGGSSVRDVVGVAVGTGVEDGEIEVEKLTTVTSVETVGYEMEYYKAIVLGGKFCY